MTSTAAEPECFTSVNRRVANVRDEWTQCALATSVIDCPTARTRRYNSMPAVASVAAAAEVASDKAEAAAVGKAAAEAATNAAA